MRHEGASYQYKLTLIDFWQLLGSHSNTTIGVYCIVSEVKEIEVGKYFMDNYFVYYLIGNINIMINTGFLCMNNKQTMIVNIC